MYAALDVVLGNVSPLCIYRSGFYSLAG